MLLYEQTGLADKFPCSCRIWTAGGIPMQALLFAWCDRCLRSKICKLTRCWVELNSHFMFYFIRPLVLLFNFEPFLIIINKFLTNFYEMPYYSLRLIHEKIFKKSIFIVQIVVVIQSLILAPFLAHFLEVSARNAQITAFTANFGQQERIFMAFTGVLPNGTICVQIGARQFNLWKFWKTWKIPTFYLFPCPHKGPCFCSPHWQRCTPCSWVYIGSAWMWVFSCIPCLRPIYGKRGVCRSSLWNYF